MHWLRGWEKWDWLRAATAKAQENRYRERACPNFFAASPCFAKMGGKQETVSVTKRSDWTKDQP